MAAPTCLIALAGSSLQVGVLRTASSAARGLRSPERWAVVPERGTAADHRRSFGFERGGQHLAAAGGPVLAFAALALVGVRAAMLVAVLPGLMATVIGCWPAR